MHVDTEDCRPPSLLHRPPLSREAWIGGAVGALGVHIVLPLLVAAVGAVLSLAGAFDDESAAPPRDVVEARFVKLGEPLEPDELPNRDVPIKSTHKPDDKVVSKDPEPQRERHDAGPPPPQDATEDLMQRLGDRAQAFAEIAERRKREGSPEGIAGGTATEAKKGNIYAGKVQQFLRRGWSVPTVLSDEEVRELQVDVDVRIGKDRTIEDFDIRRSSDNPLFDQSVRDRLRQLADADAKIPEPPNDEVADDYLGRTIGVRFRGRDLR